MRKVNWKQEETLETVLTGKHYYRSFCGLVMLGEAVEQLKIKAFWRENAPEDFSSAIRKIDILRNKLAPTACYLGKLKSSIIKK